MASHGPDGDEQESGGTADGAPSSVARKSPTLRGVNGQAGIMAQPTHIDAAAQPISSGPEEEAFQVEALETLVACGLPFLVAGTYAIAAYTGISRPTKDLDVFCKAGDAPRILDHFQSRGYAIEIEDERWIGKVLRGEHFLDIIYASSNGTVPVTDAWFEEAPSANVHGVEVLLAPPTELVWSKLFIQVRHRYDGADVVHMILRQHDRIDWRRLLDYMELHWEVLLTHLINFRWIYPSERDVVPRWLMDELLDRLRHQLDLPPPRMKICRGRMFSRVDYAPAIQMWGFGDTGAEGEMRDD
jgi:hypothetical protein